MRQLDFGRQRKLIGDLLETLFACDALEFSVFTRPFLVFACRGLRQSGCRFR